MFLREVTIHIASRFHLIHSSLKVASSSSSNESVPSVFYVTTRTTKYAVPYHPGITIRQVKALLEQSEDMNPDKIRFSIGLANPRPVYQDDATLAEYGIHPFDTLNQVTDHDGLPGGNRDDSTYCRSCSSNCACANNWFQQLRDNYQSSSEEEEDSSDEDENDDEVDTTNRVWSVKDLPANYRQKLAAQVNNLRCMKVKVDDRSCIGLIGVTNQAEANQYNKLKEILRT